MKNKNITEKTHDEFTENMAIVLAAADYQLMILSRNKIKFTTDKRTTCIEIISAFLKQKKRNSIDEIYMLAKCEAKNIIKCPHSQNDIDILATLIGVLCITCAPYKNKQSLIFHEKYLYEYCATSFFDKCDKTNFGKMAAIAIKYIIKKDFDNFDEIHKIFKDDLQYKYIGVVICGVFCAINKPEDKIINLAQTKLYNLKARKFAELHNILIPKPI